MKKTFLLLLIFSLFFACKKDEEPVQSVKDNLLQTSDLETFPFFYNSGMTIGFDTEWTTEESSSPTHSLKIYRAKFDTTVLNYWYQYYMGPMPFRETLTLTANIKTDSLNGQGVALAIGCMAGSVKRQFVNTQGDKIINGTTGWNSYSVELPDLAGDVTNIIVYMVYLPGTTGTAYFDDITLTHR
jgi:hypothetical protein